MWIKHKFEINSIKKIILMLTISLIIVFLLSNYTEDIFKTEYSVYIDKKRSVIDISSNFISPDFRVIFDTSNIPIVNYGSLENLNHF